MAVGFPGGSDDKESACNTGHLGSVPGSGRSPGEGNGLENSMDRGAWWSMGLQRQDAFTFKRFLVKVFV